MELVALLLHENRRDVEELLDDGNGGGSNHDINTDPKNIWWASERHFGKLESN
jgi:hypothetical protein